MSAKFKSSKKKVELEASIDDWDNSEEEEDEKVLINQTQALDLTKDHQSQPSLLPQKKIYQNAWDDGEEQTAESTKIPQQQKEGKELWEEANRLHPQIQPLIQNRSTLPTTLLAPRLSSPSSSSSIGSISNPSTTIKTSTVNLNGEYDHRPPPQILRRDRNAEREAALAAAAALAEGTNKKKTLAEREEEYRKARERIFGASGAGGETRSSSRTGSGSDTGGRNSPISTSNPKTTNTRTKKGR